MNTEQEREMRGRLERIDRRIKFIGAGVIAAFSAVMAWFAYRIALAHWGFSEDFAWVVGFVAFVVMSHYAGKDFYK